MRYLKFIYSETPIIMDSQEKADFISNFLLWTQGNNTKENKNCLLLNFGAQDVDLGFSQIRRVILKQAQCPLKRRVKTSMFEACYKHVTSMLQACFKHVSSTVTKFLVTTT